MKLPRRPSTAIIEQLAQAMSASPFDLLGDYTLGRIKSLEEALRGGEDLSYEDGLAVIFTRDTLVSIGKNIDQLTIGELNKNIKELGDFFENVKHQVLNAALSGRGETVLISYQCLNDEGKTLLVDYLSGLLKVPTYVDETESLGFEKEQIAELLELKKKFKR